VSKRLTIAIPESLFVRLQKVKQHLNISAICQEALDMAIALQELQLNDRDRQHLIERLRLEKKAMLTQAKHEGFQLGVKSASSLSYLDFQNLESRKNLGVKLDEEALDDLWEFLNERDYPKDLRLNAPGLTHLLCVSPDAKGAFVEGWIEGVLSVWKEIKHQLDLNPNQENPLIPSN
jgi:hypothetical protein